MLAFQQVIANARHWFEHELRQYPAVNLDLDVLRRCADRIVLTAGRESHGYPCYRVSIELSKNFKREVVELPGDHGGFMAQPAEFAEALMWVLAPKPLGAHANRPSS